MTWGTLALSTNNVRTQLEELWLERQEKNSLHEEGCMGLGQTDHTFWRQGGSLSGEKRMQM